MRELDTWRAHQDRHRFLNERLIHGQHNNITGGHHGQTQLRPCAGRGAGARGWLCRHPADPGGATNLGITHKTLASWRKVSP
ncbi:glycosyl hydrolase 108 family protein [Devosia sp. A449]